MKTNYELMNCELENEKRTLDEILQFFTDYFPEDVENFKFSNSNTECFLICVRMMLTLGHLGAKEIIAPTDIISHTSEKIRACYGDANCIPDAWNKSLSDDEFKNKWFDLFHISLFMSLISNDDIGLRAMGNWVESWLEIDTLPVIPTELGQVYISVASTFRDEPLDGQEEMEAKLLKTRKRTPKLLFQAWVAARSGDQQEFDTAFESSVKDFVRKQSKEAPLIGILAFHQAMVLAAARKVGLRVPTLPDELMAYVPTVESMGLRP